ncbi:hypothetical protein Glove_417g47 [Diversispora epigaea]|uniref:Uncharacterized protein n=1 Tax=Diversispora epigaea TaxID=1348612 RepID=A0A397GW94_9GLOM|nr:hypothetical protein Glove_417g47 [Diversispora epigaea]
MRCLSGSGPKIQSNRLERENAPSDSNDISLLHNQIQFREHRKTIQRENGFSAKEVSLIYLKFSRWGVRSSNAGSETSKSPQNYTGTIFELWEDIDVLFKEKKNHEKRSMARLYPKVAEEIRDLVIKHKKGIAISDATVRNFHKKITKNPKEDTLDSLKLWVSKQKGEPESEEEEEEEIIHDS